MTDNNDTMTSTTATGATTTAPTDFKVGDVVCLKGSPRLPMVVTKAVYAEVNRELDCNDNLVDHKTGRHVIDVMWIDISGHKQQLRLEPQCFEHHKGG